MKADCGSGYEGHARYPLQLLGSAKLHYSARVTGDKKNRLQFQRASVRKNFSMGGGRFAVPVFMFAMMRGHFAQIDH